jgi:hypothetical protein
MTRTLTLLLALWATAAAAATATSTCTAATGWATTPTNALAGPDAAFAQTAVTGQPQLQITSCAMALPAGSTVNGIQVRVVGCGAGTTGQKAIDVNLLGLGTCTAKLALAQSTCATTTDQTVGGVADLWSCSGVSQSAVNATTFGAGVSTNTSNSASNSIDLVTLTVTYTAGGAGPTARSQRIY